MLQIYLITIIFWFIINFSALVVCAGSIRDNGWLESKYNKHFPLHKSLLMFICACAIPVLRFIFFVVIFFMANFTPDEYDMMKDMTDIH